MLTLEEIREKLTKPGTNLKHISSQSELSYDVVWRVANDKAVRPSYYTILKLSKFLERNDDGV